jgi:putative hydrolase of HD superfamily
VTDPDAPTDPDGAGDSTGDDRAADDGDGADLEALLAAYALKDETRTGWDLRGVRDPESVAAHSWGVALLCLRYADAAGVDADRTLRMAVVHDVGEAVVGDLPTRADPAAETHDPEEKARRERAAVEDLSAGLGDDVRALWTAYEARDSDIARFVKDMDLVDMCAQAVVYERERRYEADDGEAFDAYDRLDEFFATAEPRLSTAVGRRLFERLRARYHAVRGE